MLDSEMIGQWQDRTRVDGVLEDDNEPVVLAILEVARQLALTRELDEASSRERVNDMLRKVGMPEHPPVPIYEPPNPSDPPLCPICNLPMAYWAGPNEGESGVVRQTPGCEPE